MRLSKKKRLKVMKELNITEYFEISIYIRKTKDNNAIENFDSRYFILKKEDLDKFLKDIEEIQKLPIELAI